MVLCSPFQCLTPGMGRCRKPERKQKLEAIGCGEILDTWIYFHESKASLPH